MTVGRGSVRAAGCDDEFEDGYYAGMMPVFFATLSGVADVEMSSSHSSSRPAARTEPRPTLTCSPLFDHLEVSRFQRFDLARLRKLGSHRT